MKIKNIKMKIQMSKKWYIKQIKKMFNQNNNISHHIMEIKNEVHDDKLNEINSQ